MKKARSYIKRLCVDLDGYKSNFEEIGFSINVETLENYVAKGTVQE